MLIRTAPFAGGSDPHTRRPSGKNQGRKPLTQLLISPTDASGSRSEFTLEADQATGPVTPIFELRTRPRRPSIDKSRSISRAGGVPRSLLPIHASNDPALVGLSSTSTVKAAFEGLLVHHRTLFKQYLRPPNQQKTRSNWSPAI